MMTYSVILNGTLVFTTKDEREFDSYCREIYDAIKFENVIYSSIPDPKCAI